MTCLCGAIINLYGITIYFCGVTISLAHSSVKMELCYIVYVITTCKIQPISAHKSMYTLMRCLTCDV